MVRLSELFCTLFGFTLRNIILFLFLVFYFILGVNRNNVQKTALTLVSTGFKWCTLGVKFSK